MAKQYKSIVEGPMGFKMPEEIARAVEDMRKKLPTGDEFNYRRVAKSAEIQLAELPAGERSDVSYITTEDVDRTDEVVMARGMDDSQYDGVVLFAHNYSELPVGKSAWRKPDRKGVLAKTIYTKKPENWDGPWMPDAVLAHLKEGVCTGKSIGFIPLEIETPEGSGLLSKYPHFKGVGRIITKWLMLEYSIAPVPCNSAAQTIAVSKNVSPEYAAVIVKAMQDAGVKIIEPAVTKDGPSMDADGNEEDDGETYVCPKCSTETMKPVEGKADMYQCGDCGTVAGRSTLTAAKSVPVGKRMPKPKDTETEADFISRAMANTTMVREFTNDKQRAAMCLSQWNAHKKAEPVTPPPATKINSFVKPETIKKALEQHRQEAMKQIPILMQAKLADMVDEAMGKP